MRIYVYKLIISVIAIFFLYHLTIGHTIYKFQNKIYSSIDKKTVGDFKEKISVEVRNSLNKERILKKEDALLLKELFIKLNSEIKNTK